MAFKNWLEAARPKTLPLAFGAITMGAFVANINNGLRWDVYLLCLFTALLLQILSNFANDYGDFKKGTDNENRVGPTRALQSGSITEKQMVNAIVLVSILCLITGLGAVFIGLQKIEVWKPLLMIAIGLVAIAAAIKYTVGKKPYGYSGLGDVFVFIFFGPVAVAGAAFLITQNFKADYVIPGIAFGCLSAGVLNINNIRDIENDKSHNKITLAVRLGRKGAINYQLILMLVAIYTLLFYVDRSSQSLWVFAVTAVLLIPIIVSYFKVALNKPGQEPLLNNQLKSLSLGSAFLALGLFVISFFI